ncbi:hypothetical protein EJ08DRAFT_611411 [Tothia fuscella]|uniref:Uncharacterized protein n=1 Tax=Tothia fuscella TaxID=1048955 RepID=A0A9P4NSZ5_9PEZI|nr:hypothetical protein EJ08DRAFT_611411 [Tothia fuscella]
MAFSGDDTNIRPLAIFTSYMLLALALTTLLTRTIYLKSISSSKFTSSLKSSQSATKTTPIYKSILFTTLAICSLATTWFYMFSFFVWSYRDWYQNQDVKFIRVDEGVQLGKWLSVTGLFKQAWWEACKTPERFWWTQQIFGWGGLGSLIVGWEGKRRGIPHLWAFILLGQIVAISFASNLFFLAVLAFPVLPRSSSSRSEESSSIATPVAVAANFICVYLLPRTIGTPYFLSLLCIPHLLLFVPLYFPPSKAMYDNLLRFTIPFCVVLLFGTSALNVLAPSSSHREGLMAMGTTLFEHPAVSSVGWDVIFCWASFELWMVLNRER